jgi:hypothetical protein
MTAQGVPSHLLVPSVLAGEAEVERLVLNQLHWYANDVTTT